MLIKPSIWEDLVQVDNGRLHCIPFSSEILSFASDFLAQIMIAPHISCIGFDVCPSHTFAARDCEGLG
jgi:hypothetical protein